MTATADRFSLDLPDALATAALATQVAACLEPGFVVHLSGDLGAGKTTFTRALLRQLGFEGRVRSPSFALLESYELSRFTLYHFDFYRLSSEQGWLDAGFDDYLDGHSVAIIEWPERAGDTLPAPDLHIRLAFDAGHGETARVAKLRAASARGRACLSALQAPGDGS